MKNINKKLTDASGGYLLAVIALHGIGVGLLFLADQNSSAIWGLAIVAYMLGVRHAFDVDHIAAIDNTIRKLLQQKRSPHGVGFYFSMGHSTVVFLMAMITAFTVKWMHNQMPELQKIGGVIGASVSGMFLLVIGMVNLITLINLFKLIRTYRQGENQTAAEESLFETKGFFVRLIRPLFRFINASWHVYPLGFLFGLGFDTASEIALLSMSAGAAKEEVAFLSILSLPILFAAGMSLMDTADEIFMTKAYRWAFHTPLRKLYYNMSVTALAVVAALGIGIIELAQVLSESLELSGAGWDELNNMDIGSLGYILVALFVLLWGVFFAIWKWKASGKGRDSCDVQS